jgi:hypothetical protein
MKRASSFYSSYVTTPSDPIRELRAENASQAQERQEWMNIQRIGVLQGGFEVLGRICRIGRSDARCDAMRCDAIRCGNAM